jgi:hypothetical protein
VFSDGSTWVNPETGGTPPPLSPSFKKGYIGAGVGVPAGFVAQTIVFLTGETAAPMSYDIATGKWIKPEPPAVSTNPPAVSTGAFQNVAYQLFHPNTFPVIFPRDGFHIPIP